MLLSLFRQLCALYPSVWRQSNCRHKIRRLRKGKFHSSWLLIKNWNAPLIKTFLELPFIPRRCSMLRFWWRHFTCCWISYYTLMVCYRLFRYLKNFSYYKKCHKIEREHTFEWENSHDCMFVFSKLLFLFSSFGWQINNSKVFWRTACLLKV